jgi:DNA repair exonuclease SbcCD ATPase subunit
MNLFEVSVQESNKVLLKEFTIENYRCIKSDTIKVDSERGIVFTGDSGVGKTTRIEALLWLLTGKLFDNSTNGLATYIMPKDATEETILLVSSTFSVGMETFILEKKMKDGETFYYVNGVKKTVIKDYNRAIQIIFGLEEATRRIENETKLLQKVDLLMLISVLDFFPTLDNKTLRELVLLVGGNVDVKTLEMSADLRAVLTKYGFDLDVAKKEIKLKLKGDRTVTGLEKQIENIQNELKTHRETLGRIGSLENIESAKNEIQTIRKRLAEIEIEFTKGEQELSKEFDDKIADKERELREYANEKRSEITDELKGIENEISKLREEYANLSNEVKTRELKIETLHQTVAFKESTINGMKERGKTLVEQKKLIKAQNEITCPKCNHVFTVEHDHSDITEIDTKLRELKNDIQVLEKDIKDLTQEEIDVKKEMEDWTFKRDEIKQQGVTLNETYEQRRTSVIEARSNVFEDEHELRIIQELNTLKNAKNNVSLELSVKNVKLKTERENLQTREVELLGLVGSEKMYQSTLEKIEELEAKQIATQKLKNAFDQLAIEIKILEEEYLKQLDRKILNAFGENIRFKMFETNASNDNLTPVCEMYVKDSFGRWVNAINGINTGHSVPRLVEFIVCVKRALNIRDGVLLIDFFESIGSEPLEELLTYGQQIIATQVVRNQNELGKEDL